MNRCYGDIRKRRWGAREWAGETGLSWGWRKSGCPGKILRICYELEENYEKTEEKCDRCYSTVSHREWEQNCGHSGERRRWDDLRGRHGNTHVSICEIDSQWEFAVWLGKLHLVLCDNLKGWDGLRGGTEVQEGGDICIILVADSCWCIAETNTIL